MFHIFHMDQRNFLKQQHPNSIQLQEQNYVLEKAKAKGKMQTNHSHFHIKPLKIALVKNKEFQTLKKDQEIV